MLAISFCMTMKKIQSDLVARFARNLKETRLEKGLSQEELAARVDLHRTYVGSVERGERNISLVNVEKLAKALKVKPVDLLT